MSEIFKPHLWTLENVFNNIYMVPVYQRPYSWNKKEQVKVLLDDIFDAFFNEERNSYFTGNIMLRNTNKNVNGIYPTYEITDGQQRITTFVLLLLVVYHIAVIRGEDLNDSTVINLKNALWKKINRANSKGNRVLTLNSIEKECMIKIFDSAFDNPNNLIKYVEKYETSSNFDKNLVENIIYIYEEVSNKIMDGENIHHSILEFADYLFKYIQFISIEIGINHNMVFSIFESINSKGKKLEEIDLIKTYVFSQLDDEDYDVYLEKWGTLIIKTKDNLYDYLITYIKSFLSFYRNNITIVNFKKICDNELLAYYHAETKKQAIKMFIDDLDENVNFYTMLTSYQDAYKLITNNKFRYYYLLFNLINYKHPKALFLRIFIEYSKQLISKKDAIDIIVETIKFMVEFLSISNRDSKDAIPLFHKVMNEIYIEGVVSKDKCLFTIASELLKLGINKEKLINELSSLDAYDTNKELSKWLLALYESTSYDPNAKSFKTSYDQAYLILNSYNDSFSMDHLLVETPDKNSDDFYYYVETTRSERRLVLKEGHDFPIEKVQNGMEYEVFKTLILNKLGNIRIYYRDKNSSRGNRTIELKEYKKFKKYSDIIDRENEILTLLVDSIFTAPKYDKSKVTVIDKHTDKLIKMKELIEIGAVKVGDELIINTIEDCEPAVLLDEKHVLYNNKKMSLNEWGCLVTGWSSIRIYPYVNIVGDAETLQDKRLKHIASLSNESSID